MTPLEAHNMAARDLKAAARRYTLNDGRKDRWQAWEALRDAAYAYVEAAGKLHDHLEATPPPQGEPGTH